MGSCYRGGTFKFLSSICIAGSTAAFVGSAAAGRDKWNFAAVTPHLKFSFRKPMSAHCK